MRRHAKLRGGAVPQLSILYLRCYPDRSADYYGTPFTAFNSLFEMRGITTPSGAPSMSLSILYLRCVGREEGIKSHCRLQTFNSLFEMPVALIILDYFRTAIDELSILYLRCRQTQTASASPYQSPFNSLFEMPQRRSSLAMSSRASSFNSLFEMLYGFITGTERYISYGAFNSLFEMPRT